MTQREGKIVLRKKGNLTYELTLESANYQSPFFPISIYCKGKYIEGHFIIKRRDPPEFEFPEYARGITSSLQSDEDIGVVHSVKDLTERMYGYAVELGNVHSRGSGLEFVDKTKDAE